MAISLYSLAKYLTTTAYFCKACKTSFHHMVEVGYASWISTGVSTMKSSSLYQKLDTIKLRSHKALGIL